jgi:hypothetical protein
MDFVHPSNLTLKTFFPQASKGNPCAQQVIVSGTCIMHAAAIASSACTLRFTETSNPHISSFYTLYRGIRDFLQAITQSSWVPKEKRISCTHSGLSMHQHDQIIVTFGQFIIAKRRGIFERLDDCESVLCLTHD